MRIAYVLPGPLSLRHPGGQQELKRRQEILQAWAAPGTTVVVREVAAGPPSIESAYEEYLSLAQTAGLLQTLQGEGFDAAIIGCFGDPCLDALYEVTEDLVVIGPGDASFHLAAMLGESFGVVTVDDGIVGPIRRQVAGSGLAARLAHVAVVSTPVLELSGNVDELVERACTGAREVVARGADTVVLGCMSMAFLDLGPLIEAAVGVPVVNPVQAALMLAEGRARFGLRHSKRAYPLPRKVAAGASLADLYVRS
ncbi:MAG TPA: aspartate/glutamate racemase family protein [Modestobacter sp.]|nr:aspartate/glutamate racemase family protein [Modestobacter sp.]